MPGVLAHALRVIEIGGNNLQRLHQAAHRQFATLSHQFVFVEKVETALHLQRKHLGLVHSKRTQGRCDLVHSPHAAQQ